jgi:hypothetical protein
VEIANLCGEIPGKIPRISRQIGQSQKSYKSYKKRALCPARYVDLGMNT